MCRRAMRLASVPPHSFDGVFGTQMTPLTVTQSAQLRPCGRTMYQVPTNDMSIAKIRAVRMCVPPKPDDEAANQRGLWHATSRSRHAFSRQQRGELATCQ